MKGYREIRDQEDVNIILDNCSNFHDSLLKEAHYLTDAFVDSDRSMVMNHLGRLRILLQSQLKGASVEMTFAGVRELVINEPAAGDPGEVADVFLKVSPDTKDNRRRWVTFGLGETLRVVARRVFWRPRSEWLGPDPRFGDGIPAPGVIPAIPLSEKRRRCENCQNVWESSQILSTCPACRELTELQI